MLNADFIRGQISDRIGELVNLDRMLRAADALSPLALASLALDLDELGGRLERIQDSLDVASAPRPPAA